jgi:hypothetical protein
VALLAASDTNNLDFVIPPSGYSIEFCESTAASFPSALRIAEGAPTFVNTIRTKKTWYLASWPATAFDKAIELADEISNLRYKKAYLNGVEISWGELFGFISCAEERKKAYRPVEYCFGKSDNRLNPWGCVQARMDWTEWADWFSYGRFEKKGLLGGKTIWIFDKARIEHELLNNLQRVKFCPFLRAELVDAVLRALPDNVDVNEKGFWKYNHSYQESPGSIKVVEIDRSNGFEFKEEYFSDGIRPKGLGILSEVLTKAFSDAGITDIKSSDLVR